MVKRPLLSQCLATEPYRLEARIFEFDTYSAYGNMYEVAIVYLPNLSEAAEDEDEYLVARQVAREYNEAVAWINNWASKMVMSKGQEVIT